MESGSCRAAPRARCRARPRRCRRGIARSSERSPVAADWFRKPPDPAGWSKAALRRASLQSPPARQSAPACLLSSSSCWAVPTSCRRARTSSLKADQIPIQIERGGHRGDHLLLELQIAHLHVISLHANVAAVHGASESLQQILRDLQIQIAGGIRIQGEQLAVEVKVAAGVSHLRGQSEVPILRVLRLKAARALDQSGGAGQERIALRARWRAGNLRTRKTTDRARGCWDPTALRCRRRN